MGVKFSALDPLTGVLASDTRDDSTPPQICVAYNGVSYADSIYSTVEQVVGLADLLAYLDFTQSSPSLVIGDVVRKSGSTYVKAQADTRSNAGAVGIITKASGTNYRVTFSGLVDIGTAKYGSLTVGSQYFLNSGTAGSVTTILPDGGNYQRLVFIPFTTAGKILVFQTQPVEISGHGTPVFLDTPIRVHTGMIGWTTYTLTGDVPTTASAVILASVGFEVSFDVEIQLRKNVSSSVYIMTRLAPIGGSDAQGGANQFIMCFDTGTRSFQFLIGGTNMYLDLIGYIS